MATPPKKPATRSARKAAPKKAAPRAAAKPKAAKPAPEPTPEREPAAAPPLSRPDAFDPFAIGADQRRMIETLSLNLARAAMTAQSAIAEAALRQADRPAALSADPFHVGPAMTSVMTSLASRPERLFQAQADLFGRYMDLWTDTARRAAGEDVPVTAAPRQAVQGPGLGRESRCST